MIFRIRPGGIYKLPFPFTNVSAKQARPALAMNAPDPNGDVRFLFITTTPPQDTERGHTLREEDFDGNPLPFPGFVRIDTPFLLPASLALKPLAQLTDAALGSVFRRVMAAEIPHFAALTLTARPFQPGITPVPVPE